MSSNPSFRSKKYCSVDCRKSTQAQAETTRQREKTMLSRYGAKVSTQSKEIRERIKESNMKKYGVEWVISSKGVREQVKKTCLKRYGSEHYMSSKEIKDKIRKTSMVRYGVAWPLQAESSLKKRRESIKEKYGVDYYSQTSEYKEKVSKTNKQRYGVSSYTKTEEFKNKAIAKMLGVPFSNNPKLDYIRSIGLDCDEEFAKTLKLCPGKYGIPPKEFILAQINGTVTETMIRKYYSDFPGARRDIFGNTGKRVSSIEKLLHDFLTSKNIIFESNNREIIHPLEIDIWLPDNNIGIEINGGYWHSSKFKSENYHSDKHTMADESGIKLLSFWEKDVIENFEWVSSVILREIGVFEELSFDSLDISKELILYNNEVVAVVDVNSTRETIKLIGEYNVCYLAKWVKQNFNIDRIYQPRDCFNTKIFDGLSAVDILQDHQRDCFTSGIIVFE